MNAARAKKIRKAVYGENAHKPVSYTRLSDGSIRAVGLRREFQDAKRAWKEKAK